MKKIALYFLCLTFLSCEEILTVPNIENETVTLLSPSLNSIIKSPNVRFSWQPTENTERYLLQVFNVDEVNGSNLVVDTLLNNHQFIDTLIHNGTYTWRVQAKNSGYQTSFSSSTFQLLLPGIQQEEIRLLSPAENAAINSPKLLFAWETLAAADNYRIQLATPNFSASSQFLIDSIIQGTSIGFEMRELGNYQWRIRGENEMDNTNYTTRTFSLIDPLLEKEIKLLTPTNNIIIKDTTVHFNWENLQHTTSYQLQVVTPDFNLPKQFILDSIVTSNQLSLRLPDNTSYQWRVKGIGDLSETQYATRSFSTESVLSITNEVIELLAPSDNADLKNTRVNLNWEALNDAEYFQIQLATPNFISPEQFHLDSITNENQINIVLPDHTEYQWRVKAVNAISETAYATRNFNIASINSIEHETISILAPINNSVLPDTSVNLNWTALDDAEHYHVQIATPNFISPEQFHLDSITNENQINIVLPDHTEYQWRVKAVNAISETAYATRNFNIASINSIEHETISILAPINNSVLPNTSVNLNWTALDEAEHYHVQIATPSFLNATQIVLDQEVNNTMVTASLQATTSYEWRVKGVNAISSTNYTSAKFKTQ